MVEVQIEHIVLDCNRLAMENLGQGNLKSCLHLLKRAQDIMNTPDFPESKVRLMVITYNNLGCYHKANNKANLALQAFEKCLDLKSDRVLEKKYAAEIHINICGIRDLYRQYENMIFHAKCALDLLMADVSAKELVPLGYYYLGRGFQGNEQIPEALRAYKCGLELSYKDLGHTHPTTCMLVKSYLGISTSQAQNALFFEGKSGSAVKKINKEEKYQRKYYFEHISGKTPEHFNLNNNAPLFYNKNTPIKAEKFISNTIGRTSDDQHLESINKKPLKRQLENQNSLNSSTKVHDCLKRNSDISGRTTPEIAVRCTSSQSKRNTNQTQNLPKIRSVSGKHRPSSSIDHSMKPPSGSSILNENLVFDNKKQKISEKILQPVPPARKKPPSSARSVHFRKPSTESLSNLSFSEEVQIPKPENLKKKETGPSKYQIILIQKYWRGFKARKIAKELRRKATNVRIQKALAELEELKKINMQETPEVPECRKYSRNKTRPLPVILEVKAEYSDGPVILIQKTIKMYLARKKFQTLKRSAVKIQTLLRMHAIRSLYQNILSAIVFIQRFWRLYKSL